MPIDAITRINQSDPLTGPGGTTTNNPLSSNQDSFGQMLSEALDRLNQTESAANQAATGLAAGEDIELHQVMLAMQEADLTFQLALQVRNKLIEAYQEVMRMQV